MTDAPQNVLFLCTGNSARSILAESIVDRLGQGRFKGFSAGSHPKDTIHHLTLKLLAQNGFPIEHLRSKSWLHFAQAGASAMDYVFTVCDQAAGESCPIWPGHPITGHWGVPDPAAAEGTESERMLAFRRAFAMLKSRIELFLALRFKELGRAALEAEIAAIGRHAAADDKGSR